MLKVPSDAFDRKPYLLNCQNGVLDLRTSELLGHEPEYMMSKITSVQYLESATHKDWDTALTALPEDIQDWLQVRYGQAITGYPVDDDTIPIQAGGGANGKSTLVSSIVEAMVATAHSSQRRCCWPGSRTTLPS